MLTRLPSGLAVPPDTAASLLTELFPDAPLSLDRDARRRLLETLSRAGVVGGAAYDGLVALEAGAHGRFLLTLDQRAQSTYRRLGVPFRVITA